MLKNVLCVFLVCMTVIQLFSLYLGFDGQVMSLIVGAMSSAFVGLIAYLQGEKKGQQLELEYQNYLAKLAEEHGKK